MSMSLSDVAAYVAFYEVKELIGTKAFWMHKGRVPKALKELFQYADLQRPKHRRELKALSVPQLIVLYGRMWEKNLKPEHLQEVEELLK